MVAQLKLLTQYKTNAMNTIVRAQEKCNAVVMLSAGDIAKGDNFNDVDVHPARMRVCDKRAKAYQLRY